MDKENSGNKNYYKKIVFSAILVFVVVVGVGAAVYKTYIIQDQEVNDLSSRVSDLTNYISKLRDQLNLFSASTTELKNMAQGEIDELRMEMEKQKEFTEKLIPQIMKRVVFVFCKGPNGQFRGSGSTQLFWNEDPMVFTNYHIADVGKPEEVRCEIHLPLPPDYSTYGKAFLTKIGKFDPNYPQIDAVILRVEEVSPEEKLEYFSAFPVEFCRSADIETGDPVTLFGYPQFGGNTLTLTNGVISGQLKTEWGPKYKTSAKMDFGNSGGLAVDNKSRCVIGMPTWTQFGGEIGDLIKTGESLGQIQSWEMIVTSGGLFK